mmetsp:Transcript_1026/g.2484  ORF Transcript_1026/g.2484 Transcript_1026/m.2484 type:complete len:403 (-) Transcript_1026:146-1354(-)
MSEHNHSTDTDPIDRSRSPVILRCHRDTTGDMCADYHQICQQHQVGASPAPPPIAIKGVTPAEADCNADSNGEDPVARKASPVILQRHHDTTGDMCTDYHNILKHNQVGASPKPSQVQKKVLDADDPHCKEVKYAPVLYHIGLTDDHAKNVFADVRFICVGGTEERMGRFAKMLEEALEIKAERVSATSRFTTYKVGPVIIANHGMGAPSVSILLNELVMALRIAKVPCHEVQAFRIGTSGGIGVEPGTIVVSSEVLNEKLEPYHEVIVMGKERRFPTFVCPDLVDKFNNRYEDVVVGKTMSANCFYNNQGRLDGAFVDYTYEDKISFLENLDSHGVKNIEMEGVCFSALLHRAGIKPCIVCMPLVNRLDGEVPAQVDNPNRGMELVIEYLAEEISARGLAK